MQIDANSAVTLHFALLTEAGDTIDTTFVGEPASLAIGDGNLLPHFEACLLGLKAGDHQHFTLPPEQAFGQHNQANLQRLKRHQFGADMVLEKGLVVSFADAANGELPGVISALEGDEVVVDFNHPLAGKTLTFEVKIISVSPKSNSACTS